MVKRVFVSFFPFKKMRERNEPDPWPTSQAVWQEWLIEAIGKIKGQKQRPSTERICHAVRQAHTKSSGPILRDEVIIARLNRAVADAKILKVCNKGQTSYKEPNHHPRQLVLSKSADLTKVVHIATSLWFCFIWSGDHLSSIPTDSWFVFFLLPSGAHQKSTWTSWIWWLKFGYHRKVHEAILFRRCWHQQPDEINSSGCPSSCHQSIFFI